jgi:hypothetical protein
MITLGTAPATSTAAPKAFFARWVDHATWGEWAPDTDTSFMPGARLVFQHLVTGADRGSALGVTVEIGGPLARMWAAIMGKGFKESAQADLDRLVALVEAQ